MNENDPLAIDPCPHDQHSPAIVHRGGSIPASVLNTCGICGNYIVRVDGMVWVAVCERESERVRAAYR
jgi:hypothetical protein